MGEPSLAGALEAIAVCAAAVARKRRHLLDYEGEAAWWDFHEQIHALTDALSFQSSAEPTDGPNGAHIRTSTGGQK